MLKQYCNGKVLDIGGLDFFLTAVEKRIPFDHWTTLEPFPENKPNINDQRYSFVIGDGCDMKDIKSNHYDTALSIQVVEHVFEPIEMMKEIARVLRPGGHAIFLIPQTGTLHMLPHHYYNFTRYWIIEAAKRMECEIVELTPLGGRWSSTASHMLYFLLQSVRAPGMHIPEYKRSKLFYVLYPIMVCTALLAIPWCLLLSIGDLEEEANNHLVVMRKK